jgi:putative aldouronate transport system substrate-binding protein
MIYVHNLVKEGILDPESVTRSPDQADNELYQGRSVFTMTTLPHYQVAIAAMNDTLGVGNYEFVPLISPVGPEGPVVRGNARFGEHMMGISSNALTRHGEDQFQDLCRFVDWMYNSDDGNEFFKWGVEGVTYTKDANGKRILNPDILYNGINLDTYSKTLDVDFGFHGGNFANAGNYELLTSMQDEITLANEAAFNEHRTFLPVLPTLLTTDIETEDLTLMVKNIVDYCQPWEQRFIVGEADPSSADWDAYIAGLEATGVDRYIEQVNEIYQRTSQG